MDLSPMRSGMREIPVTEKQARQLYDALAHIDIDSSYVHAMCGQRAQSIRTFRYLRLHPMYAITMELSRQGESWSSLMTGEGAHGVLFMCYSSLLPLSYFDEKFRLDQYQSYLTHSQMPYVKLKTACPRLFEKKTPLYAPYSMMGQGLFDRETLQRDSAKENIGGSMTYLALVAYKDRFGKYPDSLNDLRKQLGWEIPKDILSGRDFGYRREGSGFVLYGVGEDLKDDGGKPTQSYQLNVDLPGRKHIRQPSPAQAIPSPTRQMLSTPAVPSVRVPQYKDIVWLRDH